MKKIVFLLLTTKKYSDSENNIFFGGRLAEYKYYDMHQVIESALNFVEKLKNGN